MKIDKTHKNKCKSSYPVTLSKINPVQFCEKVNILNYKLMIVINNKFKNIKLKKSSCYRKLFITVLLNILSLMLAQIKINSFLAI